MKDQLITHYWLVRRENEGEGDECELGSISFIRVHRTHPNWLGED